jgi:NPCBM/NEW2 domain
MKYPMALAEALFKDNALAYQSPTMIPASATIPVQIDISNTAQLKLVADIAGDNYYCDHGDWADAKVFNSNANSDIIPPSTPNLNSVQTSNYYQINWNASTDNIDTNLDYEIIIDGVLFVTTTDIQAPLPILTQGNHVISVQAKDDGSNRAVSNTIILTYGPCPSSMTLTSPTNNFQNSETTLKTSNNISANNVISGSSKVVYQAANKIELLPGFSVAAGSVFKAQIQGCNN